MCLSSIANKSSDHVSKKWETNGIYVRLGSDTDIGEICTCCTKVLNDCWKAYKKKSTENPEKFSIRHLMNITMNLSIYSLFFNFLFIIVLDIGYCAWHLFRYIRYYELERLPWTRGNVSCMRAATHFLGYFSLAVRCGSDVKQSDFNWPYSIYLFKLSDT